MGLQVSENNNDIIKVIPFGGLGEIGKNMMSIEIDDDIVIIDCGVMFPDDDLHGVDLVIPDMEYLFQNKDRIKAILLTHGHEDHIGALPYFLKNVNVPVYGSKLTIELVKARLDETLKASDFNLIAKEPRNKVKLGGISFEFLRTTHSIADSYAIAIYTRLGILIHTGDFKIDLTPVDNKNFDFYKFAKLGENGVLALFSDSTNVERDGYTLSERFIKTNLERTMREAKGKIIVATFSSNIHRIGQIIQIAKCLDKKIAVAGKSMKKYVGIASELGYFSLDDNHFIEIEDLNKHERAKTVVIATGTQGEPMSALSLMSTERHKHLRVEQDDTVIISASVVPGNEKMASRVVDRLFKIGAHVIYEDSEDIHVSGHGSAKELKLMLALVKPKFFIPVHGDFRHLVHHANLAENMGIHPDHIMIAQNGDVITVSNTEIKKDENIGSDPVYIDGKIMGDVGGRVMVDRQMMSSSGIVIAAIPYLRKEKKFAQADIVTRGFVYVRESHDMLNKAKKLMENKAQEFLKQNPIKEEDFSLVKNYLKIELRNFFFSVTERNPILLIRVITV